MKISPNLKRWLIAEETKVERIQTTVTLAVIIIVAITAGIWLSSTREAPSKPGGYTLCEANETRGCVDPSGDGITINGTRYYSCDLINKAPCFTYRITGGDTFVYRITR